MALQGHDPYVTGEDTEAWRGKGLISRGHTPGASVPDRTVSRNDSMYVPACECDSGPRRLGARPRGRPVPRGPEQGRRATGPTRPTRCAHPHSSRAGNGFDVFRCSGGNREKRVVS